MKISVEDLKKGLELIKNAENTTEKVEEWLKSFNFPNEPADYEYFGKFVDSYRWTDHQELEDQDVYYSIGWSDKRIKKFQDDRTLTEKEAEQIKEHVVNDYYENTDTPEIVSAYLSDGNETLVIFAESYDGGMSEPERYPLGVFKTEQEAFETIFKDGEML